ncbi:MAG: pyridoxamine 5'-phosphate oxidase [Candidatus Promineifilaceae bacterium]|nr:pyridoxamine 5'-phosphate oxidase [Candidatus Promineifilaceae bacterium]
MDPLIRPDLPTDPLLLFRRWFENAAAQGLENPEAMTLATASAAGRPNARMVLLKAYDRRGFVFYSNYQSQKAAELAANPYAALVFYWRGIRRQIRISGLVNRTSTARSDAYWYSRSRGSQLSAAASPQSQPVSDRATLEARIEALDARYADQPIPRPAHWGGYLLTPDSYEFWQNGHHRLHDRFRYVREQRGWRVERLAP